MTAYSIGATELVDPALFDKYVQQVPATVQRYGGRFLAAGPVAAVLEGDFRPTLLAVMEFGSIEKIMKWYDSDEYRAVRDLRHRAGRSSLLLVDGPEKV